MTTPTSEDKTVAEAMRLAMDLAHVYSFVGDDSMPIAKAALESFLRTALAASGSALASQAIEVEKLLCDALGRPWSAAGISVDSLVGEVKARLAASGSKVDWAALKPSTGVNYEQGLWSRRNWEALVADQLAAAPAEQSAAMPEGRHMPLTDEMVSRFLGWPLPKTFAPDCGISFDGRKDDEWNKGKTWPIGTNLFTADEARAMLEHALAAPAAVKTKGKDDSPSAWVDANVSGNPSLMQAMRNHAEAATPQTAAPAAQPEPVWPSDREWIIREGDLLHLMSVKIGAAYVTVEDAAKRTNIAVRRLTAAPPPAAQSDEALVALARFGALMLRAHRGRSACEVGDIDGGTVQDAAEKCGLLVRREVSESCGESCVCDGSFPTNCLFVTNETRVAVNAALAHKGVGA